MGRVDEEKRQFPIPARSRGRTTIAARELPPRGQNEFGSAAGRTSQGNGPAGPAYDRSTAGDDQSWSALTTSPPSLVAMAHQVAELMLSLTNLTDPSRKSTPTPPGWYELAVMIPW